MRCNFINRALNQRDERQETEGKSLYSWSHGIILSLLRMEAPDYGAAKGIDCAASVSPMEHAESVFKEGEKPEKGIRGDFFPSLL